MGAHHEGLESARTGGVCAGGSANVAEQGHEYQHPGSPRAAEEQPDAVRDAVAPLGTVSVEEDPRVVAGLVTAEGHPRFGHALAGQVHLDLRAESGVHPHVPELRARPHRGTGPAEVPARPEPTGRALGCRERALRPRALRGGPGRQHRGVLEHGGPGPRGLAGRRPGGDRHALRERGGLGGGGHLRHGRRRPGRAVAPRHGLRLHSDPAEDQSGRGPRAPGAGRRALRLRGRPLQISGPQGRAAQGGQLRGEARTGGRHHGHHRLRQEHVPGLGRALFRYHQGPDPSGWPRHPGVSAALAAIADRGCSPGAEIVAAHHTRQPHVRV
mmetsp:Transcript_14724/g.42204  ORF Transcript_14724/g.42204 Transcript_14724/m.42204 type:complete len:327 (+) Transcript_14724:1123-2103(+)